MKFSIKNIKHIYRIYAIVRTVILAIISVLVIFLYNRYISLDEYINVIGHELVNFVEYENFSNNLELKDFLEDKQLIEKRDSFINLVKVSQQNIMIIEEEDKVDEIQFRENINTLLSDYELLLKQNQLFFQYLSNIGDFNNGLYSKMRKAELNFLSKMRDYDKKGYVAEKFKLLDYSIKLLIENKSVTVLNDIQKQVKEMSLYLDTALVYPDNYAKMRLNDSYTYFQASFYELAKQISAIGFENEFGLVLEIDLNYVRIEKRLEKLLHIVEAEKTKLIRYITIVISILILISLVFSILVSNILNSSIHKIFDKLTEYLTGLKQGGLSKFKKGEFIEEAHVLFDLFNEYQNQIIASKAILQSLIDNKKVSDTNYNEQSPVLQEELLKVENRIGSLKNNLEDEISKLQKISWVNKGIKQITDILRSRYDNSILQSDELIISLVNFLDVPIGALYSVDNKIITMRASFAYGEKKRFQKELVFGEGMVGTAAAERRTILVKSIPKDYFDIISGFGSSKPKSVLVCPIKLNDEVYGVIELASLEQFKKKEIEFIEEVSKTIAYSFAISKIATENLIKIDNMNIEISQLKNENATLSNDYKELDLSYKQINENLEDNNLIMRNIDDEAMITDVYINGSIIRHNKNFEEFFKSIGINNFSHNFKEYLSEINKSPDFDTDLIWKNLKLGVKYSIINKVNIFDIGYSFYNIFIPINNDEGRVDQIKVIMFKLNEQNN